MVIDRVTMSVTLWRMPNRLKEQRERLGLSQAELARMLDTTPQQISRLEKGQRGLDDGWLSRLSRALGISKASLLCDPLGLPSHAPSESDFVKNDSERRLLSFWRHLSPEAQNVFRASVDAWLTNRRGGRNSSSGTSGAKA